MTTASMPSPIKIIQGLEFIAMKYRWLAIVQHLIVLLLIFLYWVYRERMSWGLSLYFFFTSVLVGALALAETNNILTCALFGILAIMFLAETISPEMDYSTKYMKGYNLAVALLAGCYALWYPAFSTADYIDSLIASPYGILPVPTLLMIMAFFLVVFPRTNKKLQGLLTLYSFYYGIMGVFRFKMYWDMPLAVVGVYSLVMMNLAKHNKIS